MLYTMRTYRDGELIREEVRKRRDAASLLFARMTDDVVEAIGYRDTLTSLGAVRSASLAELPEQEEVTVNLPGHRLTFDATNHKEDME